MQAGTTTKLDAGCTPASEHTRDETRRLQSRIGAPRSPSTHKSDFGTFETCRQAFSRKRDLVLRWDQPRPTLSVLLSVSPVFEKVPARSPYSLCQTSSEALIYVKISSDQRRKFVGHWLNSRAGQSVLREVGVIGRLREEQKHDQVDCYCWLRVIGCNIGASYDACADSSAGGYVHASRGRLRCWQDTS